MRIIDTHAHIYPDGIAQKAAQAISDFYAVPICGDGTLSALKKEADQAGIEKMVVHSVAVTWERAGAINDFISRSVAACPQRLMGFGAMHPAHPQPEAELDRIVSLGLRGVKLHPDFQRVHLDDERCVHLLKLMARRGLALLCHTGDNRHPYSEPVRMARALDHVPSLRVICAHLGGWSVWEQAHHVLAGRDNLWIDTSSSLYALDGDTAVQIIRAYGANRAFFGTDYPMWNPKEELARFMALPLTEDERRMILAENFIAFAGGEWA